MTNVITFEPKAPTQTASLAGFVDMPDAIEPRPAFSFDMVQTEKKGFVLIDACVPMALATAFMELLGSFNPTPA